MPASFPSSLTIRLPADVAAGLDVWLSMQPEPRPSSADAVALALRDWLTGMGLLPHYDDPEMAN